MRLLFSQMKSVLHDMSLCQRSSKIPLFKSELHYLVHSFNSKIVLVKKNPAN